jgi:3-hydroxymyristoyl/3-hydroxydecanoyl-(acyl carrier protein) dehydratase
MMTPEHFIGQTGHHLGVTLSKSVIPDGECECSFMSGDQIGDMLMEGPTQHFLSAAVVNSTLSMALASMDVPDAFCEDHFPGYPMLPMAKLGQIMAQVGTILVLSENENGKHGKMLAITTGVEAIRSHTAKIDSKRKPFIIPGDRLLVVSRFTADRLNTKATLTQVFVGGQLINEMESTYTVIPWSLFTRMYEKMPDSS